MAKAYGQTALSAPPANLLQWFEFIQSLLQRLKLAASAESKPNSKLPVPLAAGEVTTRYRKGAPRRKFCPHVGVHSDAGGLRFNSAFSERSAKFSCCNLFISDMILEDPDDSSCGATTALAEEGNSLPSLTCVSTSNSELASGLSFAFRG